MTDHHHAHGKENAGGHQHSHVQSSSASRLVIALVLTGTFLIVEVAGGIIFNSLALISDAAHMFTDGAALAIALLAINIGKRPADDRRTFGYRRYETIAAAFNAMLLFVVAGYVFFEGVRRIYEPAPVQSTGMLVVATVGLLINLASMRVLSGKQDESLNVKGAYLEVWADFIGSIGVIVGALAIRFTGIKWIDPVVAIAIALWVLPRTWILLKDASQVLLNGVPRGIELAAVRRAINGTDGVSNIHDLHVWAWGSDEPSCSVHVVIQEGTDAESLRQVLEHKLKAVCGILHTTIQTERTHCGAATGHA